MGLRCSVLGHRYGDRERVEERDERGDEVITAVREVKTCERCGDELVVTESKEVTAVDPPASAEPEPPEPEPSDPDPEPVDRHPPDPDPPVPEEDDGIILPDEPSEDRGAWPADDTATDRDDTPDDGVGEPTDSTDEGEESGAWPDIDGEDEGFDAASAALDDEVADRIIEAVRADPPDPEGESTEGGFFRVKPMHDPADPSDTDPHAEYYCPRCDWSAESLVTSVRRGDICPSCRRGYVAERDPA